MQLVGDTLRVMSSVVRAFAPSKVNLALSVGAPDAAGMHPIASWMVTTRFGDDLTVKRLVASTPSRYAIEWHPDALQRSDINWRVPDDLAVRAHRALEARLQRELPVQVRLQKRTPVGGGLGGGSSDAAAMLRALNALFDLRLRLGFLEHLAQDLGSDVPYLVQGGSALVEGLGEQLERLHDQRVHLVLVFPHFACATGAVYRALDALRGSSGHGTRVESARVRELAVGEHRLHADAPFNDLADAACVVAPQLAVLRGQLAELAGQTVHVSGSGSTLFCVCDSAIHADTLAETITRRLGIPAQSTVTAPPPLEEIDGEPWTPPVMASLEDDEEDGDEDGDEDEL